MACSHQEVSKGAIFVKWGKFWFWSWMWPWWLWPITPQNNRDLNQGVFHFWFKFDDPRLNRSQVIVQTNLWLTYMQTNAGNNNRLADWIFIQLKSKGKLINPLVYTTGYTWSWVQKITTYGLDFNCPISTDTLSQPEVVLWVSDRASERFMGGCLSEWASERSMNVTDVSTLQHTHKCNCHITKDGESEDS